MSSTTLHTFDLEALNSRSSTSSVEVTHIADFKNAYKSLIIGPRSLQCETNLLEIMCCEFSDVRFDLGPLLQGQTRIAKLKNAYITLIIAPRGMGWKKNIQKIMGWESSAVFRFDLGPLLHGQMMTAKLKTAYVHSLFKLKGCAQLKVNIYGVYYWS